jgi:dienelactone hydrolase
MKTGFLPAALCAAALCARTLFAQAPALEGLNVAGDPRAQAGATWTYKATRDGIAYDLQGILVYPRTGSGPFGAVVVSHGKGGNAKGYAGNIARSMREWGLVTVAVNYTHAIGVPLGSPGDTSEDGASAPNILRGRLALEILRSLDDVDEARIAAHGHSMGAYLTAGLVGTVSGFRAASHTAGGVSPRDGFAATSTAQAKGIAIPYQLHHGDSDKVVLLSSDLRLDSILAAQGTVRELHVYPGFDHNEIVSDTLVLSRVKAWYGKHGVIASVPTAALQPAKSRLRIAASRGGFPLSGETIPWGGDALGRRPASARSAR